MRHKQKGYRREKRVRQRVAHCRQDSIHIWVMTVPFNKAVRMAISISCWPSEPIRKTVIYLWGGSKDNLKNKKKRWPLSEMWDGMTWRNGIGVAKRWDVSRIFQLAIPIQFWHTYQFTAQNNEGALNLFNIFNETGSSLLKNLQMDKLQHQHNIKYFSPFWSSTERPLD